MYYKTYKLKNSANHIYVEYYWKFMKEMPEKHWNRSGATYLLSGVIYLYFPGKLDRFDYIIKNGSIKCINQKIK